MRLSEIAAIPDTEMSPALIRRDLNSVPKGDEWMTIDDVVVYKKQMAIGVLKRPMIGVIFTHDGKKIGYAQLGTKRINDTDYTEVASIGFLLKWQRQGLGKKFYEKLLDLGPLAASGTQTSGGQTIWKWLLSRSDLDFQYYAPETMDGRTSPITRIPAVWKPYEDEILWGRGARPACTIVATKP